MHCVTLDAARYTSAASRGTCNGLLGQCHSEPKGWGPLRLCHLLHRSLHMKLTVTVITAQQESDRSQYIRVLPILVLMVRCPWTHTHKIHPAVRCPGDYMLRHPTAQRTERHASCIWRHAVTSASRRRPDKHYLITHYPELGWRQNPPKLCLRGSWAAAGILSRENSLQHMYQS